MLVLQLLVLCMAVLDCVTSKDLGFRKTCSTAVCAKTATDSYPPTCGSKFDFDDFQFCHDRFWWTLEISIPILFEVRGWISSESVWSTRSEYSSAYLPSLIVKGSGRLSCSDPSIDNHVIMFASGLTKLAGFEHLSFASVLIRSLSVLPLQGLTWRTSSEDWKNGIVRWLRATVQTSACWCRMLWCHWFRPRNIKHMFSLTPPLK